MARYDQHLFDKHDLEQLELAQRNDGLKVNHAKIAAQSREFEIQIENFLKEAGVDLQIEYKLKLAKSKPSITPDLLVDNLFINGRLIRWIDVKVGRRTKRKDKTNGYLFEE